MTYFDYYLFVRLLEERKNTDAHLLQPRVLWDLWGVLQDTSPYRLRKNPPSSGFIGETLLRHILIMLNFGESCF